MLLDSFLQFGKGSGVNHLRELFQNLLLSIVEVFELIRNSSSRLASWIRLPSILIVGLIGKWRRHDSVQSLFTLFPAGR